MCGWKSVQVRFWQRHIQKKNKEIILSLFITTLLIFIATVVIKFPEFASIIEQMLELNDQKTVYFSFIPDIEQTTERKIEWTDHKDNTWSITFTVPAELYNYCRHIGYVRVDGTTIYAFDLDRYMSESYGNRIISQIALSIKEAGIEKGYDDTDVAYMFIRLIQSLKYVSDDGSVGIIEFPKMPIQTLYEGEGDCEDFAIALSALLHEAGYKTAICEFDGHVMSAISGDTYSGTYFSVDNTNRYFVCETTAFGYNIGQIPEQYREKSASVYYYS